MEKIYRGYPLEGKKMPWMLYRREEQGGAAYQPLELRIRQDDLRELYPASAKRSQILAEEACDRLEYPGSPMYDEYPDREFLYRELAEIAERHPDQKEKRQEERDLLQVLFVNEMYRRRILNRMEHGI